MRNWTTEIEALMEMTLELLAVLDSNSEWGGEEEQKLKRLTKIAGLIDKVKKIIGTQAGGSVSLEEDERIIASLLERVARNKLEQ